LCQKFRPNLIEQYLSENSHLGGESTLAMKLSYLASQLNDPEIRTIYFVYFHELVNRFSNQEPLSLQHHSSTTDAMYLSSDFDHLLHSLQATPIYTTLKDLPLSAYPILQFLDYLVPGHAL
jgi:hypothetical protein